MIKLGIAGIAGRMGRRIAALARNDALFQLTVGLESKAHAEVGKNIEGVIVSDDPKQMQNCDCLIDFTAPLATMMHLEHAVEFKKSIIIGTTGLDEKQQAAIKDASKIIPVVFAPNMSVGVNVLFKLVQMAAKALPGYSVYIEEAHHAHKKDAPSGTAKKIAEIINKQGFSVKNEDIKAIREDEIVGDHAIVFESSVDRIELAHSAKTRDIFADGALKAARWLFQEKKQHGLFSMEEIIFPASSEPGRK